MHARVTNVDAYPRLRQGARRLRVGTLVTYLVLMCTAVITTVPFVWMLSTSLKSYNQSIAFPPIWIPFPTHWDNYLQPFSSMPFARMYLNSLIVGGIQTLGVLLTASLGAYAFARIKFFGRDLLFLLYLGTTAIPIWVRLLPLYFIIRDLHWIDTYQGLIVPDMTSAFGTFLLRQFYKSLPTDLEDAAFIDGASYWTVYRRIVLPLSVPALSALGILTFMQSWNNLLWPLIVVQSSALQTVPLGLTQFVLGNSSSGFSGVLQGPLMAAATMSVVPLLLVFVLMQERIVRGITLTGLK